MDTYKKKPELFTKIFDESQLDATKFLEIKIWE